MAANKLTKLERAEHLMKVAELHRQGRYQHEIATQLGVSQTQVSYDLRQLQRMMLKTATASFTQRRLEEIAKIDARERAAWEGWLRSCRPRAKKTAKKVDDQKRPRTEASTATEERDGNPRFLEIMEGCVEQRCRIWGLFAPQTIRIDELTDEDLLAIAGLGSEGALEASGEAAHDATNVAARASEIAGLLDAAAEDAAPGAAAPDDMGHRTGQG